ncbi:bifunctional ornithine acetyltransferase/N-acetylglutamate synthase [Amycolatopsis antarctica]|uniref:Arginine biosynthesis bifunctional protein ArgJ n=1 Tax=Amycolatopsis antarctica TaxID=1854586 RepID=A0A263CXL7_9PSEU|nr:bifunctional glutamate N-acetyltransferase/amino-acid acetyltransferase ArgJ [Amycolatopsis antarctica]OZM70076.1 bifunctional ornithine acetyltransferase/N-acetylglutamate synthase [Amycolatopsis antarctica]
MTGVAMPAGFRAAGISAGIKDSGGPDLALVVNDGPEFTAAGVFTRNVIKAAPVLWSQEVLRHNSLRAVVLNSGGANAATGPGGFQDTHATAEKVAAVLDAGAADVAVCSTGLIGERLPMDAVLSGVDTAAAALDTGTEAGLAAATAVMTTDSHPKQTHHTHPGGWSVGGLAKGAGMLAPDLATMLSVLTTDAVVDAGTADRALRAATRVTFDRLDVDGGTSTNDTVLLLASGASGHTPSEADFTALLTEAAAELVRLLRSDSEGATKEVDIVVRGAASERDAVAVGRTVAEDNLVKTALFGSDPNWGRIAMALGRADATIAPETLAISINGVILYAAGTTAASRDDADLSGREIEIVIDLGVGAESATILTTDLSHAYVEENSAYST